MADDRIALPLRACRIHVGSVVDADGNEVFVVDVNGDLPDDIVQARTATLVRAINCSAGGAMELRP